MFGFQRVGDLAWAAGDSQTRGFLIGATAGRTTLAGEGLQHQDLLLVEIQTLSKKYKLVSFQYHDLCKLLQPQSMMTLLQLH